MLLNDFHYLAVFLGVVDALHSKPFSEISAAAVGTDGGIAEEVVDLRQCLVVLLEVGMFRIDEMVHLATIASGVEFMSVIVEVVVIVEGFVAYTNVAVIVVGSVEPVAPVGYPFFDFRHICQYVSVTIYATHTDNGIEEVEITSPATVGNGKFAGPAAVKFKVWEIVNALISNMVGNGIEYELGEIGGAALDTPDFPERGVFGYKLSACHRQRDK